MLLHHKRAALRNSKCVVCEIIDQGMSTAVPVLYGVYAEYASLAKM